MNSTPETVGRHAVAIGGGIAGLFAARALSPYYERVTLVERDHLRGREHRKGTPQSKHLHNMWYSCKQAVDTLFPAVESALEKAGAPAVDHGLDVAFHLGPAGRMAPRIRSPLHSRNCTRGLLEWILREELAKSGSVELRDGTEMKGLVFDSSNSTVEGVRIAAYGKRKEASAEETISADLVVDASGRGSRAMQWLGELGYPRPAVLEVNAYGGYVSRIFSCKSPFSSDWKSLWVMATAPNQRRSGLLQRVENDRMMVMIQGTNRDYPAADEESFFRFARSLPEPKFYEALRNAEPLTSGCTYRSCENRLVQFHKLPSWPAGFVVLGDAAVRLNPLYGQGMSLAGMSALGLRHCLRTFGSNGRLKELAPHFQRSVLPGICRSAWSFATASDLQWPDTLVNGKKADSAGRETKSMRRIFELAADDPEVYLALLQVIHVVKPVESLLDLKALRSSFGWT